MVTGFVSMIYTTRTYEVWIFAFFFRSFSVGFCVCCGIHFKSRVNDSELSVYNLPFAAIIAREEVAVCINSRSESQKVTQFQIEIFTSKKKNKKIKRSWKPAGEDYCTSRKNLGPFTGTVKVSRDSASCSKQRALQEVRSAFHMNAVVSTLPSIVTINSQGWRATVTERISSSLLVIVIVVLQPPECFMRKKTSMFSTNSARSS